MTAESQIKQELIALLSGISRADAVAIEGGMTALDGFLQTRRKEVHPQLAHFLERRSYAKALAYLGEAEGRAEGLRE